MSAVVAALLMAFMASGATAAIAAEPAAGPATKPAAEPLARLPSLDAAVSAFVAEKSFSGVVLVAEAGQPIYRRAFGLANREWNVPNRPDTRFRIASVTKTFTAVLVLQAVEAGRLKLDDRVGTVLKEYADRPFAKVTVHQLLTYSSGLPATDQADDWTPYQARRTLPELIALWAKGPLVSAPGSRFAYKNLDYLLLSRVLEKVEGLPFAELVSARIVQPLGLTDTFALSSAAIVPRLATAYAVDEGAPGVLQADPPYRPENFDAAGGMVSTVDDLLRFDNALRSGRLLNAASTATMLTGNPALGYVAYGFWVYPCKVAGLATTCAERQGSISGSNALWLRDVGAAGEAASITPGSVARRSFIVLANTNEADLQALKAVLSSAR